MVLIVGFAASLESRAQHLDRAAVLTTEIVKRCNVVIRLPDQHLHAMFQREPPCLFVGGEGSGKIV